MKIKAKSRLFVLLFGIVLIFGSVLGAGFSPLIGFASAEELSGDNASEVVYSDVLADLKQDPAFLETDYPVNKSDLSLDVFQIAESVTGELFLYVYQPAADIAEFRATSVSLATDSELSDIQLYDLILISKQGVFCKYLVSDFSVKSDPERYYNISTIYRKFSKIYDDSIPGADFNEIDELGFEIAKLYCAKTENGTVTYSCLATEIITITDKCYGYVRYYDGFKFYDQSCDSWYVAFSTDRNIDFLLEAEVSFVSRDYVMNTLTGAVTRYDPVPHQKFLRYDEEVSNPGGGLFAKIHTWDRIEKVSDFVAKEDLKDEAKTKLQGKQWVLRFHETAFYNSVNLLRSGTEVSEVTILRLMFETEGQTYNLGVVDNKQSLLPGQEQDNKDETFNFWEWLAGVLGISVGAVKCIVILILLLIFLPLLASLFPVVGQVLKTLFSGLWWLICLPFRGIAALVRKIRNKQKNNVSDTKKKQKRR